MTAVSALIVNQCVGAARSPPYDRIAGYRRVTPIAGGTAGTRLASMVGRWLKPSKNDSANSTVPAWLHRTPPCEPSGNTAPRSTSGAASVGGTAVHRWSNSGTRLGVKRGTHTP